MRKTLLRLCEGLKWVHVFGVKTPRWKTQLARLNPRRLWNGCYRHVARLRKFDMQVTVLSKPKRTITDQPFCNWPPFCNSVWRAQFCLDPLTSLICNFCLDVVFTSTNFLRFIIACRNWNVMIYIVKRCCLVPKAFGTVQHSIFCYRYIHST